MSLISLTVVQIPHLLHSIIGTLSQICELKFKIMFCDTIFKLLKLYMKRWYWSDFKKVEKFKYYGNICKWDWQYVLASMWILLWCRLKIEKL